MYMNNSTLECFLLTAGYRDNGPKHEITLWAAGVSDERIRISVNDFRPMFFCPRTVPANETAGAAERKQLQMRSFNAHEADCLYFNTYTDMQQMAKHLKNMGYPTFESDINPLARYLMERMVSGSMRATGVPRQAGSFTAMANPHVRGGIFTPDFRIMAVAIDITEGEEVRAVSCACCSSFHKIIGGSERQTLTDFMEYVQKSDPDIITGWRVVDFTLRIIKERCERNNVPFEPGRERGSRVASSQRSRSWRTETITRTVWTAKIPGRVVMDVPSMLRAYNHDSDSCQLDFSDSLALAKNILHIFNGAEILRNAIERSKRTGQTLDSVGGSVASFEHLYLPRLHRAGFVANDTADIIMPSQPLAGGYVLEPTPGLYENVLVFDFKSLYPSIIMTFMIDPLGFKVINGDEDKITTPIGTSFSRSSSILPEIIRELMAGRAAAVEQKNPYLSTAIKLVMNSFAGVLGSTGCRFFSEHLSGSITKTGQHILKISIERIEKISGKKVIYGDTDSIFVDLGKGMEYRAGELGKSISKEMGAWLSEHLKEQYDAVSALELKYECHFRHFFIPPLRHGGGEGQGTKKHYCGAVVDNDGAMELTFRGMESARNDWTDLAKEFQHELFKKLFSGQPLEDYILITAERLQRGEYDDKLVYKKRMRKSIDSYTVNVPPHVQAAKQLDAPARLIKYYITKNGPQPVEKLSAPLDYRHYIDSQLGPVADSILWWMNKDFDKLISGQQDLFG
ncbi:MAG: DNA polymerase II [Chitinispirillia bacterium]|nr:DNA polymerase II [Chitinispirillia bacterium]MCL2269401.1 DNA polymerase II [Chitinispirillia bacterium]